MRRNLIRDIGDNGVGGIAHQTSQVDPQDVPDDDLDPAVLPDRLAQDWLQAAVVFYGDDAAHAPRQLPRQGAQPGADLQDGVVAAEFGGRDDLVECLMVDQKVLAEALLGADPMAAQKALDNIASAQIVSRLERG